jgi:hypothetical protein
VRGAAVAWGLAVGCKAGRGDGVSIGRAPQ